MTSIDTKIACLRSLIKYGQSKTEMIDYLISEQILTIDEARSLGVEDFSTIFFLKLSKALDSGKIMLFDFSWVLLPKEHISVTIISNSGTKEFSYHEV
jgi:hypothetical protein